MVTITSHCKGPLSWSVDSVKYFMRRIEKIWQTFFWQIDGINQFPYYYIFTPILPLFSLKKLYFLNLMSKRSKIFIFFLKTYSVNKYQTCSGCSHPQFPYSYFLTVLPVSWLACSYYYKLPLLWRNWPGIWGYRVAKPALHSGRA